MPIESATYINQLNASYPVGATDLRSTLDDHIRLIKSALQSTFAGVTGAVTATHAEMNYLVGVTSAIQTQLNAKQATVTGAASTVVSSNLGLDLAVVTNGAGKLAASTATAAEVGYLSGVTSALQTQLNAKQATVTGGATTIMAADLTASRALASDASGKVAVSAVTATELGYLSGVTSALQTQINAKQATVTGAATTIVTSDLTASRVLASNASGKVAASSVTDTEMAYLSGIGSSRYNGLGVRGACARATASVTLGNTATDTALTTLDFVTELWDTDNIHDNVTNPSRLTVPSGFTKARVKVKLHASNSPSTNLQGHLRVCLFQNTTLINIVALEVPAEVCGFGLQLESDVVNVTVGEYFYVGAQYLSATASSIKLNDVSGVSYVGSSTFSIELWP